MKKNEDKNFWDKFRSPIPPHLSPKERGQWEKEIELEKIQHERRKKEGLYPNDESKGKTKFKRRASRGRGEMRPFYDM